MLMTMVWFLIIGHCWASTAYCMLNHDMHCGSNMLNNFQVACWHSIRPSHRLLCDSGDLFKPFLKPIFQQCDLGRLLFYPFWPLVTLLFSTCHRSLCDSGELTKSNWVTSFFIHFDPLLPFFFSTCHRSLCDSGELTKSNLPIQKAHPLLWPYPSF